MTHGSKPGVLWLSIILSVVLSVGATLVLNARFLAGLWDKPDSSRSGGADSGVLQAEQPEWDRDSLYRELYDRLAALETEMIFPYDCGNVISDVYTQVLNDHPELFWLNGGALTTSTYLGASVSVRFTVNTHFRKDEIPSCREAVEARAEDILARCAAGETAWEKLLILHDILVMETEYDMEAYRLWANVLTRYGDRVSRSASVYGCLVDGRAVCAGYSAAFQMLAERMGIPCRRVSGTALYSGGPHAWNIVCVDGDWCQTDVTWDDPVSADGSPGDNLTYDYFCITTEEMLRTHAIDDPDSLPPCTFSGYGYYARVGWTLDGYDYDEIVRIARAQEGNGRIFLKCPDNTAADDAVNRLRDGPLFDLPGVAERSRDVTTSVSDMGTVTIRYY